ncbi:Protein of unknown function [Gryllus bimaculatus]|nr:Protein of unknown function [Gryllus bimaculatus]
MVSGNGEIQSKELQPSKRSFRAASALESAKWIKNCRLSERELRNIHKRVPDALQMKQKIFKRLRGPALALFRRVALPDEALNFPAIWLRSAKDS